MQPIDPQHLSTVCGGAGGALLGTLAQAAGPILQGVAGIIGASRSGGGGTSAAPSAPAPSQPVSSSGNGGDGLVSISVSINGVPVR